MAARFFVLGNDLARRAAAGFIASCPPGWVAKIAEPSRTLEQNAVQWPILAEFASQRQWPVNGAMVWLSDEEWKDVLTAAFKGETIRLAHGIGGGVVMLGLRTSKFSKRQFSEWIEFLRATAVELGVELEDARAVEE